MRSSSPTTPTPTWSATPAISMPRFAPSSASTRASVVSRRAVDAAHGGLLITADHGNAEYKIDRRDGSVLTAHTTSPVPVILCGAGDGPLRDGGGLRDVAPTVLDAMGLPVPAEMTGTVAAQPLTRAGLRRR